jgi:hypothetical protein
VAGKLVARAVVSDAQLAGTAILAWASGGKQVLSSANQGRTWKAMTLPTKKTRVRALSFVAGSTGFLLDTAGRVWRTRNGGRSWRQSLSAGTSAISGMTFGSATSGYLSVGGFGGDAATAYVLHTSDAGRSWRPQAISTGKIGASGIVAADATHAFALVQPGEASRRLFFTQTGGDAGAASPLSVKARPSKLAKRGKVTISGTLGGAIGGEQVTVSTRPVNGSAWMSQTVTAGANGGSFSATFTVRGTAVFVAQWAGDSGRIGEGTAPLVVKVGR